MDICVASFGLLVFVAFVFCAFPSSQKLQRTNPIMLAYILVWTIAMYFFNAARMQDPVSGSLTRVPFLHLVGILDIEESPCISSMRQAASLRES